MIFRMSAVMDRRPSQSMLTLQTEPVLKKNYVAMPGTPKAWRPQAALYVKGDCHSFSLTAHS
jgi:hypothetical protein